MCTCSSIVESKFLKVLLFITLACKPAEWTQKMRYRVLWPWGQIPGIASHYTLWMCHTVVILQAHHVHLFICVLCLGPSSQSDCVSSLVSWLYAHLYYSIDCKGSFDHNVCYVLWVSYVSVSFSKCGGIFNGPYWGLLLPYQLLLSQEFGCTGQHIYASYSRRVAIVELGPL